MKKQTIVIEYEDENPPINRFSETINGCKIVGLSLRDEIQASLEVDEKISKGWDSMIYEVNELQAADISIGENKETYVKLSDVIDIIDTEMTGIES